MVLSASWTIEQMTGDGDQMQILQRRNTFTSRVLTLLDCEIFSFQSQLFQSVPKFLQ